MHKFRSVWWLIIFYPEDIDILISIKWLTELKLYLFLEVTEQNINLESTVTEVLTFYCIPHDFDSCCSAWRATS